MENVVNLNEKRAVEANDARLWSVKDCLQATLRDLEAGKLNPDGIYIAMVQRYEGDVTAFNFVTAGCSALELRGLLAQHLHGICTGVR